MREVFLVLVVVLAVCGIVGGAADSFAGAIAVWHMADGSDSSRPSSELVPVGKVKVGVALSGAERAASVARGGDGRVAEFEGGYLDAGQGSGGELNPRTTGFSFAIRMRNPSGSWSSPLFSKHGGHDRLVYNLFSADLGQGQIIGFELGTAGTRGMTQVLAPVSLIGAGEWHDIVCRYDGAKLQMFVDGVWMDEGFPVGSVREGNTEPCLVGAESVGGVVKSGFRGLIDHVMLWDRSLTDGEIEFLSGGAGEVAARRSRYVPEGVSMQYYRPHNQFNVGDTLPFYHEGRFHFYYLLDRGHHSAKGGQGAHQWAHASSTDLVRWTMHPLAIPITRAEEGSICTGSVFFHGGTYYAFYASRLVGKGEHLSLAKSTDAIHFTKTEPNPFLSASPRYGNGFRDPHVFVEKRTGRFHLLVSTMLREGNRGCLAHYSSVDLKEWRDEEPFLIEGSEVPECPDYFEWNGRYYLIFSNGQVARYRMSKNPLGPWEKPQVDVIDGPAARVLKTAAFKDNRRIGTASIWPFGYAGWSVFRELVQLEDGSLGSKFPAEMIPETGHAVGLELEGDGDARRIRVDSRANARATLKAMPRNARIRLRIDGSAKAVGLRLRASGDKGDGHEIRFFPAKREMAVTGGHRLAEIGAMDGPFGVDIVMKDRILDVCVGGERTLVNWVPDLSGDRMVLYVEDGAAAFEQITVNPLRSR